MQAHHPAPLGDPAITDESELFEQAFRPGVQVGAALRVPPGNLLGIGLDQAPAQLCYRSQRCRNSGPRHTVAAVPGAMNRHPIRQSGNLTRSFS